MAAASVDLYGTFVAVIVYQIRKQRNLRFSIRTYVCICQREVIIRLIDFPNSKFAYEITTSARLSIIVKT